MPWLAATALLHSINVLAARGGLRAWTMMLALVAFSMSMVGTFLVRSGILTSVHAFAVDPTRGTFILVLLALYVGGALTLFAFRIAHVKEGAPFEVVSREGGLVANNLLLSVILGIVFLGTLYPLLAEAVSGEKLSVGLPYFDSVASPLALILAALMMIAPQLKWRRDAAPILPRLAPGLVVAVAVLVGSFILTPDIGLLPRLGLAIGAGLLPASLQPLFGRSLRRTPLATWGMCLAHFGVAVVILGMASDSAFTREKLAAARPGETVEVGPWLVEFRQVMPVAGPNWTALEGELRASKGSGVRVLKPQSRFFPSPPTTTNEAAIDTSWNGQLYAVLGEQDEQGRWQLRLWWKPFVTLIWFGGILIGLGGALALVGRLVRERRQRIRGEEAFL
jgi:cytochrome c-type biogenesis protein CcmF